MKLKSIKELGKKDKDQLIAELVGKYEQTQAMVDRGRTPNAKELLFTDFRKIMEKYLGEKKPDKK